MQISAEDTKDTKKMTDRAKIAQHLPKSLGTPLFKGVSGREVLA